MLANRVMMGVLSDEDPSVTLVDDVTDLAVNNNTWTVNNVNFGGAALGGLTRHMVVVVTNRDAGSLDTTFTFTVTIGGVTATNVSDLAAAGGGNMCSSVIAIAAVPSGSSGTVVVALTGFSGTMESWAMAVYRVVGISSATPTFTDEVLGSNITTTVPTGGFGVVGGAAASGSNVGSFTGTGAETAYSGTLAGAAMLTKTAGSTVYDASQAIVFTTAAWDLL